MAVVYSSFSTLAPYWGVPGSYSTAVWAVYPPEAGCTVSPVSPEFDGSPRAQDSDVTLTLDALRLLARAHAEGISFRITKFVVGANGYDPAQFYMPVPVTPEDEIIAPLYEGVITNTEEAVVDGSMWSYTCAVPGDVVAVMGEVGLIAEILESPEMPSEVGTELVFALAHVPAETKARRKAVTFRFILG